MTNCRLRTSEARASQCAMHERGGILRDVIGRRGCAIPQTANMSRQIDSMLEGGGHTYKMANFRGFNDKTGNRTKQITKQAKAARLQAPKMSSRSHRLTVARHNRQYQRPFSDRCTSLALGRTEGCMRPMRVMTTGAQELGPHHKCSKTRREEKRDLAFPLTSKPSLLLFATAWSRQRGTWSLMGRKPHVAPRSKGVQRLEPRQDGGRGRGADRDIRISPAPA